MKGLLTLTYLSVALLLMISIIDNDLFAQTNKEDKVIQKIVSERTTFLTKSIENGNADIFGTDTRFVENIGQYGDTVSRAYNMGSVKYGYEGFKMPVLFTEKGLIYLQGKIKLPSPEQKERMLRKGMSPEEIASKNKITTRIVTMEWLNANIHPEIITENMCVSYNTYGLLNAKAKTFKKIIYKELYPGIDVEYYFTANGKKGFEYNIVAKPGADLSVVKMKYGGDIKTIYKDNKGNLCIKSSLGTMKETVPHSFYADATNELLSVTFFIDKRIVHFNVPFNYNHQRTLVIDPFVTGTSNLTGISAGKAKDVDFDYEGNVYITGGGDQSANQKLAKYNSAGILQWTFAGTLTTPSWTFGPYYGGWVVDKTAGSIYMGQGFNFGQGFIIIRLNTAGLYDNYISTGNPNFVENWKMIWSCNNGTPQIIVAGGGVNSNINLGICAPPSTSISATNITNIPGVAFQDMADMVIDPVSNAMYTLYASGSVPALNNSIYKNNAPYSNASIAWNIQSGFASLQEAANRPYLSSTFSLQDNSTNILALNASYLFYWDGLNLKAYDKTTGAGVGTPITIAGNTKLMQGGIIADACNNIFIGSANGIIKVYHFTGTVFDDAAAVDISIPGFNTVSVYDLAYNETQKIIYASGDGFVASFDVSGYLCPSSSFSLSVNTDCLTSSANVTISPTPPPGSTVTYTLYNGTTQVTSNTTGVFTSLNQGVNYTLIATINQACSGVQTSINFTLPGPGISLSNTNSTCGNSNGTITVIGSAGLAPYTFSIDGVNFNVGGSFTSLTAGSYTLTVKDAAGCQTSALQIVQNTNGPALTYTKTDATCGNSTGTITANGTGVNIPFQYSIDGTNYQSSNFFTGLLPGNYTLTIKDTTDCINTANVKINAGPATGITATPSSASCSQANGSITAFGTGGTPPLQYSVNGNTFQASNVFTGLTSGAYIVVVQDANGCIKTTNVTVGNVLGPTITATPASATCNNANGSITANGLNGTAPLEYSIDGTNFQSFNVFGGLVSGIYTVTVRDANGCSNTVNTTVNATGAPAIVATSTVSACNSSTGTITASASGGVAPLTYSINGLTFQASTLFTGLPAGSYFVFVKDFNGCISAFPIGVGNSTAPTITATATPSGCNLVNGTITASATGGNSPYQYNINGSAFQLSNVFTGLQTGLDTIKVKDANGCTSTTIIFVDNVAGLTLTPTSISSNCSGNNAGVITAIATGNNLPLEYSIDGINFQTSNVFNGLSAGIYTVYVRDASGCSLSKNVSITSAFAPTVTASFTNSSCNSNSGTITAAGTGGTGSLQYSINGVTFQSGTFFNNVAPGTYTVTVKDLSGCTNTTSVTITNNGAGAGISTFTVVVKGNFPCNSVSTGKITNPRVNGSNCGSCTFSLDGGAFISNSTQLFLNVSQGVHTVTAMNASGCTRTLTVTLGPEPLSTASTIVTGSACGTSNGTIKLTGIGPTTPYHASINGIGGPWITFDPSYTFTGLAPGTYTITIADDESFDPGPPVIPGGCLTTLTVIVPSIGGPTLSISQTPGTCGLNNASINANGSGGSGLLTYSIDGVNFQGSSIFNNLAVGVYNVIVMDATGCSNTASITVTNSGVPSSTITVAGATCGTANGIIKVNGIGGTSPLTYSVNGILFQSSNLFTNLLPGTYAVYVKDVNGCYSTTNAVVANTPLPKITAFTVPASCNNNNGILFANGAGVNIPMQYSIDGINFQSSNIFLGLMAGPYTVSIKDSTGCTNQTGVAVGNLNAPALTVAATSTTCNGTNGTITATGTGGSGTLEYSVDDINFQSGNVFTGLSAGAYNVSVRDANGCLTNKAILIRNINGPQTLSAVKVNAKCDLNNGSLTLTGTGGTAPLKYSIDGINFQSSGIFNALPPSPYTLTVIDANLCIKTLEDTIQNLSGPELTTTATTTSCYKNDGAVTALATGGTVQLAYSNNGLTFQSSNVFTNLQAGTYTITVKDANNCLSLDTAIVSNLTPPTITASIIFFFCGADIIANSTGVPQFKYSMDSLVWQTSNVFSCILPGTYPVYVNDANNCVNKTMVTLLSPLPIELLSFEAQKNNDIVDLNWTTASEKNNDFFTLEKSKDAVNFEAFAYKKAAGNSNEQRTYTAIDNHPFNGINYYHLKQTDFNGTFTYSDLVSVRFNGNDFFHTYPNPVVDQLSIFTNQKFNVVNLIDVTGRNVRQLNGEFTNQIKIDLTDLPSGCYSLDMFDEKVERKSVRIMKN